jgi:hypothetical protein
MSELPSLIRGKLVFGINVIPQVEFNARVCIYYTRKHEFCRYFAPPLNEGGYTKEHE